MSLEVPIQPVHNIGRHLRVIQVVVRLVQALGIDFQSLIRVGDQIEEALGALHRDQGILPAVDEQHRQAHIASVRPNPVDRPQTFRPNHTRTGVHHRFVRRR